MSALFAALTAIFAKVGVSDVNADFATLIRTLVIVPLLAALFWMNGQWQSLGTVSSRTWTFLVLSAVATGASWLCYFRAMKLGDAARVAPLDKMSVVLVAILGVLVLGERLGPLNWLGVVLIAGGVVLVAWR